MENRSTARMAVLLQFLLFSIVGATVAALDEQHPLATSASLARRGLDMKCTCTICQNPCDDYPSPPPPDVIYNYPPPPAIIYSSPPPPEAIYYYSPPPPSTPYSLPPPVQPVCCGGGGSSYSPYGSWFSPPGVLYPQDPGYHPGVATQGHVAWWLSLLMGGALVLWCDCASLFSSQQSTFFSPNHLIINQVVASFKQYELIFFSFLSLEKIIRNIKFNKPSVFQDLLWLYDSFETCSIITTRMRHERKSRKIDFTVLHGRIQDFRQEGTIY